MSYIYGSQTSAEVRPWLLNPSEPGLYLLSDNLKHDKLFETYLKWISQTISLLSRYFHMC